MTAENDIIPPQPITGIEFVTLIVTNRCVVVRYVPIGVHYACKFDDIKLLS